LYILTSIRRFLRQNAIFLKIKFERQPTTSVRDIAEVKQNIPVLVNPMRPFDQYVGEDIQLSMKSSEIGTRTWSEAAQKSRKAECS
jgi:hypothetical protein